MKILRILRVGAQNAVPHGGVLWKNSGSLTCSRRSAHPSARAKPRPKRGSRRRRPRKRSRPTHADRRRRTFPETRRSLRKPRDRARGFCGGTRRSHAASTETTADKGNAASPRLRGLAAFLFASRMRKNYLLENCGARRAFFKPYFFLSLLLGSRVRKPSFLSAGRSSGCAWMSAREMPWRIAPA